MKYFVKKIRRNFHSERGQTSAEYIIILAVCSLCAVFVLFGVGNSIDGKYQEISGDINITEDGETTEKNSTNVNFTIDGQSYEFGSKSDWNAFIGLHSGFAVDKDGNLLAPTGGKIYYLDNDWNPVYVSPMDYINPKYEYRSDEYFERDKVYVNIYQGTSAVSIVSLENTMSHFYLKDSLATVSAVVLPGHTFSGFYKKENGSLVFVNPGVLNSVNDHGDQEYFYTFKAEKDITLYALAD